MPPDPNDGSAQGAAPSKLITGVFDDDGTAQRLVVALKAKKGIISANMTQCRGVGADDELGRFGRLPPAKAMRVVSVVVSEEQADELFDFICDEADIDRPQGGFVYQGALVSTTTFALPDDVMDERRFSSERRSRRDRRRKRRDTPERRAGGDRRLVGE